MSDSGEPGPAAELPETIDLGPPGSVTTWTASDAIAFGWRTLKRDPMVILVVFVADVLRVFLLSIGAGANAAGLASGDEAGMVLGALVYGAFALLNFLPLAYITVGLTRYLLKLSRGQPADFGDLFKKGPFLQMLGAIILAELAISVGLLFCIVPGIILALGLCLYAYVIVDRGADVVGSLKQSWALTTGHKGRLFVLALLMILVQFLGVLACLIGTFVTTPIVYLAGAYAYLKIIGENPEAAA